MKNILKTKAYWILSLLATGVIFVSLININHVFESKIYILVSSKSSQAVQNIDQIASDAKEIPLTLSFYNTLLINNPELKNVGEGKSDYRRKGYWNDIIATKRLGKSGIIQIAIKDENRNQSENLAHISALALAQEMSKIYNIKNDIDVRIIDGPITSDGQKYGYPSLIVASLAIALVAIFISFGISFLLERKVINFRTAKDTFDLAPVWSKTAPAKEVVFKKPEIIPEIPEIKEEIFKKTEAPFVPGKKSVAPDNLPVAETAMPEKIEPVAKTDPMTYSEPQIIFKEPTPEEVKERLNRLLSGRY